MPKAVSKKVAKRAAGTYEIIPPDTIQIVSYSELDTFRQCPLKHHLLYQRRWTKPAKEGSALDKGSLYHLVMEAHYRTIKEVQDAHRGRVPKKLVAETLAKAREAVMEYLVHPITGEQSEVQELIEWMYDGYVECYGVDPDWRVVGVEHQIIQPLPNEYGVPSRYHLKMKIDLLVREWSTGNLWVVDHKSGANLPSKMDLEIDDQFGLYTWGMRAIGRKVMGSLHNANRTQRNKSFMPLDTRMGRTYLNRVDKELDNLALDAYYAARAAYPDNTEYRARYSAPDPRSCGWKCDVKEPHLLMRTGRNPDEVMVEYGFTVNRTRH